jgi:predicted Zn-dependent protease
VSAALREALFGNRDEAKRRVASALELSSGRDVLYGCALTLSFNGDSVRALELASDLGKRFPEDTVVRYNYLPTLQAQLALNRKEATEAISKLQTAAPYELAVNNIGPYVIYVRGVAFLSANRSSEALVEFQKILDHRGLVANTPMGALAHLQLGRAYSKQGDTAGAKAAYQDFLTLWKDADPEIPIFIAAKAEYAKLQ